MGDLKISITILLDDYGMIGRECLECERYFKLKPGTGLDTAQCHCPYCDYAGKSDTFWTQAQLKYVESIAMKEAFQKVIEPSLKKLQRSFEQIERSSRNSLIKIKVKSTGTKLTFPIKYYTEEELETKLTCDNCGLEFAIYGVFSKCPDCNELNAFLVYEKSIEVTRKKLDIFSKPEIPNDIKEITLNSIISSSISSFDGLGKELRKRKPEKYPDKPKNLFQNLFLLNERLDNYISDEHTNFKELLKLFQVRHIIEHNMGVIDEDFVQKMPEYSHFKGRKYSLDVSELYDFLEFMKELGQIVKKHFEK